MRAVMRVVIEEISDEEALKLKRRLDDMVSRMPGSTVELQLMPALGMAPPPPPSPISSVRR